MAIQSTKQTKQKRTPGLIRREGIWHIDKQVRGRRLCESTGTGELAEAEHYLARRLEEIRQAEVYGVRPKRTFRQAATKYLNEATKSSIGDDASRLKKLDEYIGDSPLDLIHMGTLAKFIEGRKKEGVKMRTINQALKIVRRIVNLAATEWIDEHGLTWLQTAPKIKLLAEPDLRKPRPITWDEQSRLLAELPNHLRQMVLFKVNTGCREKEVCQLRWSSEVKVPEMNTSVFILPGKGVKNRQDRLVVLNQTASDIIESRRGKDPEYVFTFRGKPLNRINNSGWRKARKKAGLPEVRVHDLKHTFGRRLRALGVSFEDRQDLLGHKSSRITTHYSAAELDNLIKAADSVCGGESRKNPAVVLLRDNACT